PRSSCPWVCAASFRQRASSSPRTSGRRSCSVTSRVVPSASGGSGKGSGAASWWRWKRAYPPQGHDLQRAAVSVEPHGLRAAGRRPARRLASSRSGGPPSVQGAPPPLPRRAHSLAANGVEDWRQRTPKNAVRLARQLLDAGADPDALAGMYGGQHATMSMLVSSSHPATAGVQVALVDTLVDYGAAVEARGVGEWTSPLSTALAFGYRDAAEALVRRGARVD